MRRLLTLLTAGGAALTAGCASLAGTLLNGPADLDERRRTAELRETDAARAAASRNVLHWTDRPVAPDAMPFYQPPQPSKR